MVLIELETSTLAVLIAGLYCTDNGVDSQAIPQSVWFSVAEKLEFFIPLWDFNKLSFEDWVATSLFIYPTELIDETTKKDMVSNTIYWEMPNGNVLLSISMDIKEINNV